MSSTRVGRAVVALGAATALTATGLSIGLAGSADAATASTTPAAAGVAVTYTCAIGSSTGPVAVTVTPTGAVPAKASVGVKTAAFSIEATGGSLPVSSKLGTYIVDTLYTRFQQVYQSGGLTGLLNAAPSALTATFTGSAALGAAKAPVTLAANDPFASNSNNMQLLTTIMGYIVAGRTPSQVSTALASDTSQSITLGTMTGTVGSFTPAHAGTATLTLPTSLTARIMPTLTDPSTGKMLLPTATCTASPKALATVKIAKVATAFTGSKLAKSSIKTTQKGSVKVKVVDTTKGSSAKPTGGTVTATIKGKKVASGTLKNGAVTLTLKKQKKGTYKVVLTWKGTGDFTAPAKKTLTLKVK